MYVYSPGYNKGNTVSREQIIECFNRLKNEPTPSEKVRVLRSFPPIREKLDADPDFSTYINQLHLDKRLIALKLLAMGQEHLLTPFTTHQSAHIDKLLDSLLPVENFYGDIQGVLGYQKLVTELLKASDTKELPVAFVAPDRIDLSVEGSDVDEMVYAGILAQGEVCEISPVGGAAERLSLKCDESGIDLPAAKMEFLGCTLLEGIVRDLIAREYLHYKLLGKQVLTPLVLMTSSAKDNHQHILQICEERQWFQRDPASFHFVKQPSVPTFDDEGKWQLASKETLSQRPNGHGSIWKMIEKDVIDGLLREKKQYALVRQINNPVSGMDCTLPAFIGYGVMHKKQFGFVGTERVPNVAEGVNVTRQILDEEGNVQSQVLSNVEYVEIEKLKKLGEKKSFCANTNILFANLGAIQKASRAYGYPGCLLNFKTVTYADNEEKQRKVARLETTMQNIADAFEFKQGQTPPAFLAFNIRRKTLATTKKLSQSSSDLEGTPRGAYFNYKRNIFDLFSNQCEIDLEDPNNREAFSKETEGFIISFAPCLGPLWSVVSQKIHYGKIAHGSELRLEIADLFLHHFELNGSLLVEAENLVGEADHEGIVRYNDRTGRVYLRDVRVENKGCLQSDEDLVWSGGLEREESLHIVCEGCSAFIAQGVTFKGAHKFVVPDGMVWIAREKEGVLEVEKRPLEPKGEPQGPFWQYETEDDRTISLSLNREFISLLDHIGDLVS
ncbi:MAG: hypothetical protein S4CHLAM102_04170 [Chlamydiia bacterium]|nr:hypothetical protein [Chlamydiia bacterium]